MPALCSPFNPAVPYLPPLQPGQERPRSAPGPRKNLEARDQRTRGNGRSRSARAQPIRCRKADGPDTSGAANPEAGSGRYEVGDSPGCRVHLAAAGGSRGLRSGGWRSLGEGAGRMVSRRALGQTPAVRPRLGFRFLGESRCLPRFASGWSPGIEPSPAVRRLAARP